MSDDLGTEHLRFERRGPVGWCVIDRPEARNALTPMMYAGLGRAISLANRDPGIEALVITGMGDTFIPGGDLRGGDEPEDQRLSALLPWNDFRASLVPIVAAINGLCYASGVMVAMLSDVAVASDRATFRIPELTYGIPDMWMAAVLPAHVGVGRARELLLTNRRFDAEEARAMGIIERVVDPDRVPEAADSAVSEILGTAPLARNLVRQALVSRYGVVEQITMDWGPSSPEATEGSAAFVDKREPSWRLGLQAAKGRPATAPG